MKIYTKTGDSGETGLFGGARVSKASLRVRAYGEVDELNSAIGWVRVQVEDPELDALLNRIQNDLFEVGAELGSTEDRKKKSAMPLIAEAQVEALERAIDEYEQGPPALTSFVLPGGSESAARFHLARCVCRRAERSLVDLGAQESVRGELFRYINRLSDLLFVLARYSNHVAGVADIPWKGQSA
ncbi:MAG: cob(I)yrinic acid a,c-diamide adenosyltransferase [Polyangiales bacterium]